MSLNSAHARRTALPPASRARDITAVALLVGSVLLLVLPAGLVWASIGWAAGAGLLWSSATWSTGDKLLGTLVWPGGLIGPAVLVTSVGQVCTRVEQVVPGAGGAGLGDPVCTGFALSPWVGVPLALVVIAAPLAVAAVLLGKAARID